MMSQVYGDDRYDCASTWHKNCHFCCAQSAAYFHGSFLQKPLLFIADRSLLSCAFISALPAFNTLYKPIFYLFTYLCNRSVSHCLSVCPGIRSSLAEQNCRAHQSSTHRLGLISLSQCASSLSTSPTITTCPHISLRCFHHHHHHFSRIHHHHHHHQHGLFRFVSAF